MSQPPAVAVVVPCFNQGATLPEALGSVRAQTYARVECVVVDDGSTDAHTQDVLRTVAHQGIRVISQANQGLAGARNTGVQATQTAVFVPLDADDRLHPEFIERLLPPLLNDEQAGYTYCYARYFGARYDVWRCPPYRPKRLILHNLSPATALIRRQAFDAVGGYRPDMREGFEDWDLWLAMCKCGFRGRLVPVPLFEYRQYAPGASMRSRAEAIHDVLVRRMIAHHHDLYRGLLGLIDDDDDTIFEELQAAIELERIERSQFWRLLHPSSRRASGDGDRGTPGERLARVRASRAHRLIQAVKRTRLHRWYAARRYGQPAEQS